MATVLVLSFSDLASDARVNRQLRWLAGHHDVLAAGLADPVIDGVRFVPLVLRARRGLRRLWSRLALLCRDYERYYWHNPLVAEAFEKLHGTSAHVIVANDLVTLPLARRLAGQAQILFDAHEYPPQEFGDRLLWRLLFRPYATYLCRRHIPHAHGMLTVSAGIARAFRELTGVLPTVLTNAPAPCAISPRPYREGQRPIQLVYHGAAISSRKLENLITMMDHLPGRFELNLMLAGGEADYRRRLEKLAQSRPAVRMLPAAPLAELVPTLNQFDIGVYSLEPVSLNNHFSLPNKLFEFIQARLAVAVGPSPEMARVVRSAGCGVVACDFKPASLAACLRTLTETDINAFKKRAHAASYRLSAAPNQRVFLNLIEQLLAERRAA